MIFKNISLLSIDLFISLRYLFSKNKKIFNSLFINILSILGIMLGVASVIVTLSIMNGFKKNIVDKIFATNYHASFLFPSKTIVDYDDFERDLLKLEGIEKFSPFIIKNGILKVKDNSFPVILKGVKESEIETIDIKKCMKVGDFISDDKKNSIVLGKKLLERLGLWIGDEIIFISPNFEKINFPFMPSIYKFVISGVFDTGIYEFDTGFAFINIDYANYIFDMKGKIDGYGIRLKNPFKVDDFLENIRKRMRLFFYIETWQEMNKTLFSAIKMEKLVMGIVLFLIILVASFGIISSLLMLSIEKTNDIGILKTIGFRKLDIIKIFLYQSSIMSIIGIVLGIILSGIIIFVLKNYDFIKIPSEIYFSSRVPVELKINESFFIIIITFLICTFSSIYPALKASNASIIDAVKEN